jgi:hypothetical protein
MHSTIGFLQAEPNLALLIAVLIFLITIFLVVKKWIGFSIATLLLLFSLAAGLIVKNQQLLETYATDYHQHNLADTKEEDLKKQIFQALEDVKTEISTEKENIRHIMIKVQEIFEQLDNEKQNLQHFIAETTERFKTETEKQINQVEETNKLPNEATENQ